MPDFHVLKLLSYSQLILIETVMWIGSDDDDVRFVFAYLF